MTHRKLIAALALAIVPLVATGQPHRHIDECVEAAIGWTNLPTSVPGQIAISPCTECTPVLLEVAASTRFFVGDAVVDFPTLQRYAKRDGRQTRVCHDGKQKVTRLLVSGNLDDAELAR